MLRGVTIFVLFLSFFSCCRAETFTVRDIELSGLKRISPGKVFSELPLKVGDKFSPERSSEIFDALYGTGFFEDISLGYKGGTLLIDLVERAGIKEIKLFGNKTVETEQLLDGLARADVAVGRVFDRLAFERLKQELKNLYYGIGKYNAKINADIEPVGDNQVVITINLDEGEIAAIRRISITGNRNVTTEEILDGIQLSTRRWYEFWSSKDQYSRAKLAGDLETLRDLYQNRGYLNFDVLNAHVTLSPDKKDIHINIEVKEGERYRFGDSFLGGEIPVDRQALKELITIRKGRIFSRRVAVRSSEAMKYYLKDRGYAFATVDVLPQVHEEEAVVDIAFIVKPQRKTYVRRINILGNDDTDDRVFRRELRQLEGGEYSARKVELSKRRLRRLPYVESVEVEDYPVAEADDRIDLDFKVTERLSGNFNIGLGFSDSSGAVLSFGLYPDNFLGTGNRVGFTFNNSDSDTRYAVAFHNPFYTLDGVSRSWNFSYRSVDYEERDISSVLSSDSGEIRVGLSYGIPVSENDYLHVGGRIEDISITLDDSTQAAHRYFDEPGQPLPSDPVVSAEIIRLSEDFRRFDIVDCIEENSGSFVNLALHARLDYDTRDRTVFTKDGTKISTSAELYTPISDSDYFKLDYQHQHYWPLDEAGDFVLGARGRMSYARSYNDSCIPYYDKYYAGGSKTVRGYFNNSLGPRDAQNDSVGGNFRILGGADLFFPTDFLYDKNKLRMSLFTDVGNVFAYAEDFKTDELRGSYGLQIQWLTAIGGISFNFASHFNDKREDRTESFQFDLGTRF